MRTGLMGMVASLVLAAPSTAPRLTVAADLAYIRGTAVYVHLSGGRAVRRLDARHHSEPALSPTGGQLALTLSEASPTSRAGSRFLAIQDGSGAPLRKIFGRQDHHCFGPRWSPDGTLIAFNNLTTGWGVAVVGPDGQGARDLLCPKDSSAWMHLACWAPDGKSIYAYDFNHLYRVNLDGHILEQRSFKDLGIDVPCSLTDFSLAPDGRQLLIALQSEDADVVVDGYPGTVIVHVDLLAKTSRRISPVGVQARNPHWLANGTQFLYVGFGRKGNGLYQGSITVGAHTLLIPGVKEFSLTPVR